MKGIPPIRLKRLKRSALLLGAGVLVAGASLLGASQANAAVGTQPGALSISPASGPTSTPASSLHYSTTTACPAGNQGSGLLQIVDPGGGGFNNMAPVNNSVTSPFSGTLNSSFALAIQVFPDLPGTTAEMVIQCYTGPSATGTAIAVQDTFVTFSADGSTYSTGTSSGPAPTTTMLIASPSPATVGQTVTLTATVTDGGSTPAGSVQFETGGTAINSPVTTANGVAATTTTFAATGTESLSAVFTPTNSTAFGGSTGTASLTVNPVQVNSGTIPLTVTVGSTGQFTLTVDTTDTVTLAVSGSSATAATTPIVVSDTRNTFPGWSVSGQDSNWTGSGTAAGATISGNQLGWTPTSSTSPLTQGVTLGGTVAPASPGLGSTPAVLASVHAGLGNGFGTTTLGANLTLAIPSGQAAGPYSSGLNITAVDTNP